MRVILLNDFAYVNGGASKVALATAVALAERNIDTLLFTGVGPIDSNLLNVDHLKVVCLEQYDILNDTNRLRAMVNGLWNRKAAEALRKILIEYDCKDTVIHVHTCQKALTSACIRMAISMNFKVLYHIHDYGVACPNLGFYDYQKGEICKKQPLSISCLKCNCDSRSYLHKLWRCLRQYIQVSWGMLPTKIENFIVVSNFSFNIMENFLPKNSRVFNIGNPISLEKYKRIQVENNKNFVFIGRLTPEKNVLLLAEAANILNVPVVFIGSGICEAEIKRVCPSAQLTGWLNEKEIAGYIEKARCLVLPSACYETQGLVVYEMAGRGIPSIVADTCAAREYIVEGKNGLLFTSQDLENLKKAMKKVMQDATVSQMGICAYDYFWKESYDVNKYMGMLFDAYREILRKH